MATPSSLWTLVLAAGAGRRLASVTGGTPKQFWRPPGRVSLLDATMSRIAPLAPPSRTVLVVDRSHAPYLANAIAQRVTVAFQPSDRGTAVGALLGLITVLDRDPDGFVCLMPSDHAIDRPDFFRSSIRSAVRSVRHGAADIVVFGVEPTQPTTDYGWIKPGLAIPGWPLLSAVTRFVEKPAVAEAERLMASGAVWNTMVVVARAEALLNLYARHLPGLHDVFTKAAGLGQERRQAALESAYPSLPHYDFSRDILARAGRLSLAIWPVAFGWSDLGTPDRLHAWLRTVHPPATSSVV
jgi:mannose-1-phosphate guanylyltransferase